MKTLTPRSETRSKRRALPAGDVALEDAGRSASQLPHPLSWPKRITFIALAGLFLVLGVAGIVLPGLPTTPFLLLTSYFLLRSWPSMNERLLRSRLLGGVLRDWQHHQGVRRHVKVKAIVLVAATVGAGLFFFEMSPLLRGILGCGAVAGLLVIRRLPEVKAD